MCLPAGYSTSGLGVAGSIFDAENCADAIQAFRHYREVDEKLGSLGKEPRMIGPHTRRRQARKRGDAGCAVNLRDSYPASRSHWPPSNRPRS
jgi:hypothetical protein